jgi:phage baseplate assembly protein W
VSFQVSAADLGRIRLNEPEAVNAVLQNIALVLATPKGSVPMYRDFGLPQDFLDKPAPVAKARMIASVREAVEEWEPRATVRSISFEESPQEPGKLMPRVEVEIHVEE